MDKDKILAEAKSFSLMMRQGKIAAPPILFDSKTNSTGRMWSEDDIEAARAALKAESSDS